MWGTVLKSYEKESFLKSFSIFFLSLAFLSGVIAYLYHMEQRSAYERSLLAQMKLFNYDFKNPDFSMDIIPIDPLAAEEMLVVSGDEVFALFSMPRASQYRLKVIYPYERYMSEQKAAATRIVLFYALIVAVLFALSILYALYALRPMRDALALMETFLKDVIHDLNTPVSAILLNTNLLQKRYKESALDRIALSAKTIGSLYENLETAIRQVPMGKEEVNMAAIIEERGRYYEALFPNLTFLYEVDDSMLYSSPDALRRILDNLISNACKYNRPKGEVAICWKENVLSVRDTGIGIKHPEKVFERFYKEGERGLGMGMNIVKKLCDTLGITITVQSTVGEGSEITLRFEQR